MDSGLILSIASFTVSIITILVVYMTLGLRLTYEFVEKKENLELRAVLEKNYLEEIRKEIKKMCQEVDNLNEVDLTSKIYDFGLKTTTRRLPSTILRQINWNFASMTKKFTYIIIGSILILFSILGFSNILPSYTYSDFINIAAFIGGIGLIIDNLNIISLVRRTIKLRNSFLELDMNRSFEYAMYLEKILKDKACISSPN